MTEWVNEWAMKGNSETCMHRWVAVVKGVWGGYCDAPSTWPLRSEDLSPQTLAVLPADRAQLSAEEATSLHHTPFPGQPTSDSWSACGREDRAASPDLEELWRLIPASELSWGRLRTPLDCLTAVCPPSPRPLCPFPPKVLVISYTLMNLPSA